MTAELLPAYFWICDDCGLDNFGRATEMPDSHPYKQEIQAAIDEAVESEDLAFLPHIEMMPEFVKCAHCGAVHEVAYDDGSEFDWLEFDDEE